MDRANELRRQAESQCERMLKRWVDEKVRRETAENRVWELEKKVAELQMKIGVPTPIHNNGTTKVVMEPK